jgi:hypothetical protein
MVVPGAGRSTMYVRPSGSLDGGVGSATSRIPMLPEPLGGWLGSAADATEADITIPASTDTAKR